MLHNEKSRLPFSKSESGALEFNFQSAAEQLFSFASGKSDEIGGTEALKKAVQQFSLPKGLHHMHIYICMLSCKYKLS